MRLPLTDENLSNLKFDPKMTSLYNSDRFDLVLCYKYTREEVVTKIQQLSISIIIEEKDNFWLKTNINNIISETKWNICPISSTPSNIYREPDFINRELFLNFSIFTNDLINLFINKYENPKSSIETYRDCKDISKILSNYQYLNVETLLPGNITLIEHITTVIYSFINKDDMYNLMINIINK